MVTTDALKLLYKKLGGTADVESITAISDMVDLIEDVAGGGGGGASALVVHATMGATSATLDKNYKEITEAMDSGVFVYVVARRDDSMCTYYTIYGAQFDAEDSDYSITLSDDTPFHADSETGVLTFSM